MRRHSPYNYAFSNPVFFIDPDGMEAVVNTGYQKIEQSVLTGSVDVYGTLEEAGSSNGNESSPIFGKDGKLLGTDSEGYGGKAIVMDEADFDPNMDHDEALSMGTELDAYGDGISITDESWDKIVKNGGTKMIPYVKNQGDAAAYYKPEGTQDGIDLNPGKSASGAYPISPKSDLYAPVDGVATIKYNNAVFKVLTGTNNIIIRSDGSVKANTNPVIVDGWIVKDGYYYKNGGILTPGLDDGSWDMLYEKANSSGGKSY